MISESTARLKFKVKVDEIDIDQLMHYHLILSVAANEFTICVIDTLSKRCLLGEKHSFELGNSTENLTLICDRIIEDHHLLKARFWKKITVAYASQNFTLIPNDLIEDENLSKYLELHGSLDLNMEAVKRYNHKNLSASNIFSIPKTLQSFFSELYGDKVTYVHQTSSFIEGILAYQNISTENKLFINYEHSTLTIIVLKAGKLEYCNQFKATKDEDLVYYTMFVMNELYLNPETTLLTLWGDMEIKSDAYLQLFKFIRNVKFGKRNKSIKFSYNFDELNEHQLFSTLGTFYCE